MKASSDLRIDEGRLVPQPGRAIANGTNVAIFDLNDTRGVAVAESLGERAIFCKVNVVDETSVVEAMTRVIGILGLNGGGYGCTERI
ncbi:hypothetical protein [Microbulbifer sp. ALW1]|uniref:hypothetical protein n=1 Tax=Microbulbifer sp. (strain ALW1) TaxID=1516059 RepID=UPI001356E4E6|nr:hypothetical protein [Microbulbifer sp. ALW1]